MSITADDWTKARELAIEYVKTELRGTEPIELRGYEATPFLFAARWAGGQSYVLVVDGKVERTRGVAVLPAYFAFLGEDALRAMPVSKLDGLLQVLGARPRGVLTAEGHPDLAPAVVDTASVLKYVVHVLAPGPGCVGGGTKPPGPSVIFRLSLQLFPVLPELEWKREAEIERPAPPPPSAP